MRPRIVVVPMVLAGALVAFGCSSVLGLGDFTDGKPDASANGGAGGTSGDSSVGGTGGSAGAMPDAGGAGGTDAGDAGPGVLCSDNDQFTVLADTDTAGKTADNSLFVVGDGAKAYVVMGSNDGSTVLVQTVTDKAGPGRVDSKALATVIPPGSMNVTGAQLAGGKLHIMGYGNYDNVNGMSGIDVAFDQPNPPGIDPNSASETDIPLPGGCTSVKRAFYTYDSAGQLHSAVACDASDGGSDHDLYVDGALLPSAPAGSTNEVTHFALSHGEYVLLTGEGPGVGLVYHAKLATPPAKPTFPDGQNVLFASQGHATWLLAAWPAASGTSLMALDVTRVDGGYGFGPPTTVYQGVPNSLDDLAQVPPPGLNPIANAPDAPSFQKLDLYGKPEAVLFGTVMVGEPLTAKNHIAIALFSPDGSPYFVDQSVATAIGNQKFLDAAAGPLGGAILVVRNVYSTKDGGSVSTVEGDVFDCLQN